MRGVPVGDLGQRKNLAMPARTPSGPARRLLLPLVSSQTGEACTEKGASPGGSVNAQRAPRQGDSLLHTKQSQAVAAGAVCRLAKVEAPPVIGDVEHQLVRLDIKSDGHATRLCVSHHVCERLLHQPEARDLDDGSEAFFDIGDVGAEYEPGAFHLARPIPAQRRSEPEVVEYRWSQIERQVVNPADGLIDEVNALAKVDSSVLEIETDGGEHLAEVIVKLSRDRASLGLLSFDQASGQSGELLALLAQRGLGALAFDGGG